MKKLLFALALIASMQVAGAQTSKSVKSAQKAVEKATVATQNEKKAAKSATWIKLGESYLKAEDAPKGNGWLGANIADLQLIQGDEKPISVDDGAVVSGTVYYKEQYETRDQYYDGNGTLVMIVVTAPAFEDALEQAAAAFKTAGECADVKAKVATKIAANLSTVAKKFNEKAYQAYAFGDTQKACYYFEQAAITSETAPCCQVDTNSVYNAGFLSYLNGDYEKAKVYLLKSEAVGYYGDDGEVFVRLADIATKEGDVAGSLAILEDGFSKFPQSQGILIALINYYLTSGENADRLFELIDAAKQNEPNNASLYYVEGNIHEKLGQLDEAVECWHKCSVINPDYEYGFIAEGLHYYNEALEIQEVAMNEMDYKKYNALMDDMEAALKKCVIPFENAYNTSKDESLKVTIADYIKQVSYRYYYDDENYKAKYEFYKAIVDAAQAE